MPDKLPKPPALMLRDMLVDNWDKSNTSGLTPAKPPHEDAGLSMNRGWYSTVDFDPHVALHAFREPVSSGGNSGYTGIDPSGDGPTQTRLGRGNCEIFAEGDSEYGTDEFDAPTMVFRIRQEIEDIIHAAEADNTDRQVDPPDPWTHVSASQETVPNDTEVTPVVHRSRARANYSWEKTP